VCDRYPKVRIGFMESGGGWIAPWLDRMNRHFDDQGFNDSGPDDAPERALPAQLLDLVRARRGQPLGARDYIGPHKILWATDYPHPDGFFPGAPKLIADRPELSAETKRQILAGGAKGFYGLK
jgi:predicted TIM-barrel fold metal-dependent hydrolase